jgi:hypothetical protein
MDGVKTVFVLDMDGEEFDLSLMEEEDRGQTGDDASRKPTKRLD